MFMDHWGLFSNKSKPILVLNRFCIVVKSSALTLDPFMLHSTLVLSLFLSSPNGLGLMNAALDTFIVANRFCMVLKS